MLLTHLKVFCFRNFGSVSLVSNQVALGPNFECYAVGNYVLSSIGGYLVSMHGENGMTPVERNSKKATLVPIKIVVFGALIWGYSLHMTHLKHI